MVISTRGLVAGVAAWLLFVTPQERPPGSIELKDLRDGIMKSSAQIELVVKELQDLLPEMLRLSKEHEYKGPFIETGGPLSIATYIRGESHRELHFELTLLQCLESMSCDQDRSVVAAFARNQIQPAIEELEGLKSATENRLDRFRELPLDGELDSIRTATVKAGEKGVAVYGDLIGLLKSAELGEGK